MSFVPCELHCHTVHSDGGFDVKELQRAAKENGLSLIALTDHNTVSGHAELQDEMIPAIRGIEWTTYFGHMLVLGAKDFVDWRNARPDNIDEKICEVRSCGGIVGVAHPYQLGSPMCTGGRWEFNVKNWENVSYVEIWHEAFSRENYENKKATDFWTSLLDKGHRLAATYGRDWHRPEGDRRYGCTYVDIRGEVTPESALEAIKSARTVASTGALFCFEIVQNEKVYSIGDELENGEAKFIFTLDTTAREKYHTDNRFEYEKIKIVTNGGVCVKELDLTQKTAVLELLSNRWYRAELWGKMNGEKAPLAITSPVYTK